MKIVKYLIVGGGMTADSAARAIRGVDADGSIGMIAEEADPPYDRPPLSKGLWKGKSIEKTWRNTEALGVELFRGRRAVFLEPVRKEVVDDQDTVYRFEKLLLATGGRPRHHPSNGRPPIYYRTMQDYRNLRALADQKQRFLVIGGGFIGSEIAAALAMNGKNVTMVLPESGICGRLFPASLAACMTRVYEKKGVRMLQGRTVVHIAHANNVVDVTMDNGETVTADGVVAGLGIALNTDLAERAGLRVDNGILVDECLETTHESIYAAGDVANFYCPMLQSRLRVEHEDNANAMGKQAGMNMTGENKPYHYLPFFYSDLFDDGYEAIGETDPRHEIVEDWEEPHKKGVIFYVKQERVRGVLLWNVFGKVNAARDLIASPEPCDRDSLHAWSRGIGLRRSS